MNAPGKGLLQIDAALLLLLSTATSMMLMFTGTLTRLTDLYATTEGLSRVSAAISLGAAALPSVSELVAGLMGIAFATKPGAGRFLSALGLIVIFFNAVPVAVNWLSGGFSVLGNWQYLTALLLSILFLVGAGLNRRAVPEKQIRSNPFFYTVQDDDNDDL